MFNFEFATKSVVVCVCSFLDETMNYLIGSLKRDSEQRSATFQAIGLLAVSVQSQMTRYLPRIMEVIRISLPARDTSQRFE
jgi:FKBP12-rapamycin complex-associated protein